MLTMTTQIELKQTLKVENISKYYRNNTENNKIWEIFIQTYWEKLKRVLTLN